MKADLIVEIAGELGVKPEALKKWRQRGTVPHRWRLAIAEQVVRRGVDLPDDVFADAGWHIGRSVTS